MLTRTAHARLIAMIAAVSVAVSLVAYSVFGDGTIVSRIIIDSNNLSERLLTLEGGLRLFRDHPIFGAGLGAFQNEGHKSINGLPLVIHSTFVWLLAETGLAGFAVFVFGAGYALKREFATLDSDRVSAAIFLLLTVMVIMGLPADMLYQRTFWLFIGALLAIPVAATARGGRHRHAGPDRKISRTLSSP
jgi:O-antigen ligase